MGHETPTDRRACVVVHAQDDPAPDRLVAALEARAMRVQRTPSVHEAFAAACVARRGARAPVIVLDRVDPPERLREALDRFVPSALLWTHDPGANPPLRAFVEPPRGRATEPPSPPAPAAKQGRPALRLTGAPRRDPTSAEVLDPDELEALLRPRD